MKKKSIILCTLLLLVILCNYKITNNNKNKSITLKHLEANACTDMEGMHGYIGLMTFCTRYVVFSNFPYAGGWVGGCTDANSTCTIP